MTGVFRHKFNCFETKNSHFCLTLKFSVLKFQISKCIFSCKACAKRCDRSVRILTEAQIKKTTKYCFWVQLGIRLVGLSVYSISFQIAPNIHKSCYKTYIRKEYDPIPLIWTPTLSKKTTWKFGGNGHFTLKDGQIIAWKDKSSQDSFVWCEF